MKTGSRRRGRSEREDTSLLLNPLGSRRYAKNPLL